MSWKATLYCRVADRCLIQMSNDGKVLAMAVEKKIDKKHVKDHIARMRHCAEFQQWAFEWLYC